MSQTQTTQRERKELKAREADLAFAIVAPGMVRVRNEKYDEDDLEHTYIINIEVEKPNNCQCPSFRWHDGWCYHMVALANRPALLASARKDIPGLPDDDADEPTQNAAQEPTTDGGARACVNDADGCPGPDGDELPCLECYQVRKRE